MPQPPSILFLNTHDTGRVVSPMGHAVRTPNLQRLAGQGVTLRNLHCAGPTCSPSRAALLTGMAPHSCGQLGLGHRGWHLTDPAWTLPSHLRAHGYATAAWGMPSNHCTGPGVDQAAVARAHGYDDWLSGDRWVGGHAKDLPAALGWLASPPADRPFFLSLSWFMTHRAGDGFTTAPDPALYDPRWTLPPPPLPDTAATRADWAHFLCDIEAWDRQLGEVLAALERSGRADNTIVLVTTDHGPPFPGMKCTPSAGGSGVFAVLRGPGFAGGLAVDALLSQIDVFPTLCAAAGVPAPARLHGVDFRPALAGAEVRSFVAGEVTYHAAYEPWRSLRTRRHLFVRRYGHRRLPRGTNYDSSPSRDLWLAGGWGRVALPDEELFDSLLDPQERRNLIGDPQYAAVARDLSARLDAWMRDTADPLLHGDVPPPPGVPDSDPDDPRPGQKLARHL